MNFLLNYAFLATLLGASTTPIDEIQDGRIVGGADATPGQFPYQVSLRRLPNSHFCGGSIISPRHILTAAHCVSEVSINSFTVVTGSHLVTSGGTTAAVSSIRIHASFGEPNYQNDIAVIKLATPLTFSATTQPIALNRQALTAGRRVTATGWGYVSYPNITRPTVLQYIELTTLDLTSCQRQLPRITITAGQVCTTSPAQQGTCMGDSGGPLVTKVGANYIQVGVVSFGIPCANALPDVFTSVSYHITWVEYAMRTM